MRKLSEVKADLIAVEQERQGLLEEVKQFQKRCPHPKDFVTVSTEDYYDNCGAPVYEETYITYCCLLCEISATKSFDKDIGVKPTFEDCLKK